MGLLSLLAPYVTPAYTLYVHVKLITTPYILKDLQCSPHVQCIGKAARPNGNSDYEYSIIVDFKDGGPKPHTYREYLGM